MSNMEHELRLLKQKVDLLIDGYQVLYMRLDQQNRILRRVEAVLTEDGDEDMLKALGTNDDHKVVRMSDRFLARVRKNHAPEPPDFDPDDKTLA